MSKIPCDGIKIPDVDQIVGPNGLSLSIVTDADMQAAPTWATVYSVTTDPGIAGAVFNFNGVPTFSTGFVYRRPGGTDGYLRPSNQGTYNRP